MKNFLFSLCLCSVGMPYAASSSSDSSPGGECIEEADEVQYFAGSEGGSGIDGEDKDEEKNHELHTSIQGEGVASRRSSLSGQERVTSRPLSETLKGFIANAKKHAYKVLSGEVASQAGKLRDLITTSLDPKKDIEIFLESYSGDSAEIVNYQSIEAKPALMVAVHAEKRELFPLLVRYGALVNMPDANGEFPLGIAFMKKGACMVEDLLWLGASLVQVGDDGNLNHDPRSLLANMKTEDPSSYKKLLKAAQKGSARYVTREVKKIESLALLHEGEVKSDDEGEKSSRSDNESELGEE